MICSKLFSGDLPEITNYIIQYLRNDLKSLYSCILVNRLLCRIAIPILWEDPFSLRRREGFSRNFLDTYLLFFNENDKTKLKEFGITINSPSFENPLFNNQYSTTKSCIFWSKRCTTMYNNSYMEIKECFLSTKQISNFIIQII